MLVFVMVALFGISSAAADVAPTEPMLASDFVDRIGINIHSALSTQDFAALLNDVTFLKIRHLRDGIRPLQFGDSTAKIALTSAAGIDWDVIIPSAPAPYQSWLANHRANIISVEGPNEPNLERLEFGGLIGTPAAAQLQHVLFGMARSDPRLSDMPILNYSMGYYTAPQRPINVADDFDLQNLHIYPGHGQPPMRTVSMFVRLAQSWSQSPITVSEIGYTTTRSDMILGIYCAGGVSPEQQAAYVLDSLADDAVLGVSRTYLYDLIDDGADPSGCNKEDHYGLFNRDHSPKIAAFALHNLISILTDGTPAEPRGRALSLGIDPVISSLLIEGGNGVYDVILWQEAPWPAGDRLVGITLEHPAKFRAFDPILGTAPVASGGPGTAFQINVGRDPVIVEMKPVERVNGGP